MPSDNIYAEKRLPSAFRQSWHHFYGNPISMVGLYGFGALLLLAAWLTENGRETERDQLLAWHLLPWSTRFLSVFVENAGHPFYTALGKLAQLTLADWQSTLLIPVAEKPLYR